MFRKKPHLDKRNLIFVAALQLVTIEEDQAAILKCVDKRGVVKNTQSLEARVALLLTIEKNYFDIFTYLLNQQVALANLTELHDNIQGYQGNLSVPFKQAIQQQRVEMVAIITDKIIEQYDPSECDHKSTLTILRKAKYVALGLDEEKIYSQEQRAVAREDLLRPQKRIENIIDKSSRQIQKKYEMYQKSRLGCSLM